MSFLENNFFLLAITFGIFFFAKLLQKKTGLVLLNPILLVSTALAVTSGAISWSAISIFAKR